MTTHAYVYTVACTLNSRLLSGHLGVVAGTLRGVLFPVCYGSVGVQLTRLRALRQCTLTSECVWKNLNATVLQVTCTTQQSSRVFFLFACLKGCFRLSLSTRNKKTNGNQQKTRPETSKPPTVFTTALIHTAVDISDQTGTNQSKFRYRDPWVRLSPTPGSILKGPRCPPGISGTPTNNAVTCDCSTPIQSCTGANVLQRPSVSASGSDPIKRPGT